MSEASKKKASKRFYIPDVSLFTEGNIYTGSENTFNFRIGKEDDRLKTRVWYGMKCFELSESSEVCDTEVTAEGIMQTGAALDAEYAKYLKKLESGETEGRRTYIARNSESE